MYVKYDYTSFYYQFLKPRSITFNVQSNIYRFILHSFINTKNERTFLRFPCAELPILFYKIKPMSKTLRILPCSNRLTNQNMLSFPSVNNLVVFAIKIHCNNPKNNTLWGNYYFIDLCWISTWPKIVFKKYSEFPCLYYTLSQKSGQCNILRMW